VSMWEETQGEERLRDIRGAGDMIGIERFLGSDSYLYSAKAAGDVVLYAFHSADFEPLIEKYPQAGRYVAAHASASSDYQAQDRKQGAHQLFITDAVRLSDPLTCSPSES